MSKAFTKESDLPEEPLRAEDLALPPGVPNYVTPAGLVALREAHQAIEAALPAAPADERPRLEQRLALVARRLELAEVVDPRAQPTDVVRFGATVTVEEEAGARRRYRLVGVDEADARRGLLSWRAPIARALLGLSVGDTAEVQTPSGEAALTVVAIAYE